MTVDESVSRRFLYLVALLQETGVDPKLVPQEQLIFRAMTPLEKLGYSQMDVEAWVSECDTETDPVACFRAKVKTALRPPMSLAVPAAVAGAAAFAAAFSLTRRHR